MPDPTPVATTMDNTQTEVARQMREKDERIQELEDTFRHTHQAMNSGHDLCKLCCLDLRDKIHARKYSHA